MFQSNNISCKSSVLDREKEIGRERERNEELAFWKNRICLLSWLFFLHVQLIEFKNQ